MRSSRRGTVRSRGSDQPQAGPPPRPVPAPLGRGRHNNRARRIRERGRRAPAQRGWFATHAIAGSAARQRSEWRARVRRYQPPAAERSPACSLRPVAGSMGAEVRDRQRPGRLSSTSSVLLVKHTFSPGSGRKTERPPRSGGAIAFAGRVLKRPGPYRCIRSRAAPAVRLPRRRPGSERGGRANNAEAPSVPPCAGRTGAVPPARSCSTIRLAARHCRARPGGGGAKASCSAAARVRSEGCEGKC